MDTARRILAILSLVTLPPGVLFWFIVHPFTPFWRRRGKAVTYTFTFSTMGVVGYILWRFRDPLLGQDFGTHWPLVALAAVLYSGAMVIEVLCRRHLTLRTLVGVPQLEGSSEKLLDQGIYGRIRHPRYVDFLLAGLAVAVFCNYLGIYVLALLLIPVMFLLTVLEERELVQRFGDAYRDYRRRVPRFLPRLGSGGGDG